MDSANDRHHATLDGLRGFAALSVVIYHVGHWLGEPLALNSGLAVDLFFLLSGYVLTLAYRQRLSKSLSALQFIRIRLIRLGPLVVLGTLISAAYVILRIYVKHEDVPIMTVLIATALGLVDLPYLTSPRSLGGDQIFPLNGPQYSLFLEIVCNAVWAAIAWLRGAYGASLAALICLTVLIAMGVLGGDTAATFIAGFPRVGASFLGGVAIYYVESSLPAWRGWTLVFWVCAALMATSFYFPSELTFGFQIAWIGLLSPLLILSGARVHLRGRTRFIALLAGRLSYPIYVLHYPMFTWINGVFQMLAHRRDVAIEGSLLVIFVALGSLVVLRFYDEPVRRKLACVWDASAKSVREKSASKSG